MNVLYDEKYYDNGWTYAELDSYIKYKLAYYWALLEEMPTFKECACTLSYIGLTEDEYYEWEVNDRLHNRVTRVWPKPSWDWTKE